MKKLIGQEITQAMQKRIARLEEILLCGHCDGSGVRNRPIWENENLMVRCPVCNGTGNRLDALREWVEVRE